LQTRERTIVGDRVVPTSAAVRGDGHARLVRQDRLGTDRGAGGDVVLEVIARSVLTAEADGTERTTETDKSLTGGVAHARTVRNVEALLNGEHTLQAVTQIFDAAEAQTAARQATAVDSGLVIVTVRTEAHVSVS